LKKTLFYIALLTAIPVNGQVSLMNDTIKIMEVVISRNKVYPDAPCYKKTTIDSSVLKYYKNSTLDEILAENSRVLIKSYGMGGTATPSFRGTGASHTQIAWDGISINNPMLGQTDLSLVPVGLIDDIQIYYGGASMATNSGGIGGIINLETKPVWKKKTLVTLNSGIGSFGNYRGLLAVKVGNIHFQSITKAWYQSSENDFRYLNSETSSIPVWETRKNSQVQQKGFLQELYFMKSKNIVSARIWYQSAHRNLASSILIQPSGSGESQFDESLRAILNYDINRPAGTYFITGAWFTDRLNYFNKLASIESINLSDMLTLKAGMEKRVGQYAKLKFVLNEELNFVRSNNYSLNKARNTSSITALCEYNGKGRFGKSILIREIIDNNKLLIPDFSLGMQFRIVDSEDYLLKANFSKNSKIPTMNDMYWSPGGNPGLKNEYAFIYECTYEMKKKINDPVILKYDLTFFYNHIKDMIQWHPGEYSYWTADNIQTVNSSGVESSVSIEYARNRLNTLLNAGYSFTRAVSVGSKFENDLSAGKQLIYIPENQANLSLRIGFQKIYSSWVANFTGKRYTSADNSKYLTGYFINNLITGIKLPVKRSSIDLSFSVDNLFNVNYQTIAYYPLPGRSYFLKINFQLVN
jgi:outer membrane cobalamin receptor